VCREIRVVILYPSNRISQAQERQFTTLGENITALEVDGTFDDCQRLVKQAFTDEALNKRAFLTSANSINIGRLLPQMFYHVAAYRQLPVASTPLVVAVPSGNFGNLTAGLFCESFPLGTATTSGVEATGNCRLRRHVIKHLRNNRPMLMEFAESKTPACSTLIGKSLFHQPLTIVKRSIHFQRVMFSPSVVNCLSCAWLIRFEGYRITTRIPGTLKKPWATALPVSRRRTSTVIRDFRRAQNIPSTAP